MEESFESDLYEPFESDLKIIKSHLRMNEIRKNISL